MSTESKPVTGLHHTALRTAQFDRSVAFYTEMLGLTPKIQWGEVGKRATMLDAGDGNYLEIFEREEPEKGPPAEARWLHLCFRSSAVEATVEKLRVAGVEITVEPKKVELTNTLTHAEHGKATIHLAFFKGPDGEIIELIDSKEL
jgi:glyoxylase I family protein